MRTRQTAIWLVILVAIASLFYWLALRATVTELRLIIPNYSAGSVMFNGSSYNTRTEDTRQELIGALRQTLGPEPWKSKHAFPAQIKIGTKVSAEEVLNAWLALTTVGIEEATLINSDTKESATLQAPGGSRLRAFDELWKANLDDPLASRASPWLLPNSKKAYAWLTLKEESADALGATVLWPFAESFKNKASRYLWIVLIGPNAGGDEIIKYVGGLQQSGAQDVWLHWESTRQPLTLDQDAKPTPAKP